MNYIQKMKITLIDEISRLGGGQVYLKSLIKALNSNYISLVTQMQGYF